MMVQEERNTGTIITVFSTSSSVGKTVLSINLAAQLAKERFSVCLVDLDFQFGDVCHYLKLDPKVSIYHYQESKNQNISDYFIKYNDKLSVLAAPTEIEESYNIETPVVLQALNELKKQFDYVVLDTAPGFSDVNLAAMDISNLVLFVGILDFLPTIKNMKIGYNTMLNVGYSPQKIRFILNRSNAKKNIGAKDVESILGQTFYHDLPNEFATTITSIRNGIPMVHNIENSEYGKKIAELVYNLLNPSSKKKNEDSWIKRIFGS